MYSSAGFPVVRHSGGSWRLSKNMSKVSRSLLPFWMGYWPKFTYSGLSHTHRTMQISCPRINKIDHKASCSNVLHETMFSCWCFLKSNIKTGTWSLCAHQQRSERTDGRGIIVPGPEDAEKRSVGLLQKWGAHEFVNFYWFWRPNMVIYDEPLDFGVPIFWANTKWISNDLPRSAEFTKHFRNAVSAYEFVSNFVLKSTRINTQTHPHNFWTWLYRHLPLSFHYTGWFIGIPLLEVL